MIGKKYKNTKKYIHKKGKKYSKKSKKIKKSIKGGRTNLNENNNKTNKNKENLKFLIKILENKILNKNSELNANSEFYEGFSKYKIYFKKENEYYNDLIKISNYILNHEDLNEFNIDNDTHTTTKKLFTNDEQNRMKNGGLFWTGINPTKVNNYICNYCNKINCKFNDLCYIQIATTQIGVLLEILHSYLVWKYNNQPNEKSANWEKSKNVNKFMDTYWENLSEQYAIETTQNYINNQNTSNDNNNHGLVFFKSKVRDVYTTKSIFGTIELTHILNTLKESTEIPDNKFIKFINLNKNVDKTNTITYDNNYKVLLNKIKPDKDFDTNTINRIILFSLHVLYNTDNEDFNIKISETDYNNIKNNVNDNNKNYQPPQKLTNKLENLKNKDITITDCLGDCKVLAEQIIKFFVKRADKNSIFNYDNIIENIFIKI
jgi:hypothetical protein